MFKHIGTSNPLSPTSNRRSGGSIAVSPEDKVAFTSGESIVVGETSVEIGGVPFDIGWSPLGSFLAVTLPNALKVFRVGDAAITELWSTNPFNCDKVQCIRLTWHPSEMLLAVYSTTEIKLYDIDFNTLMKRKDLRFQRCIWSAYGSNLFLLGFGELHILHVSGEVQRLKLPCNRKVRNVVALPENVLVIAFDMDESEIYTQFDIQGHRGWNSSPTELMIAQSDKKSSKIPFNVDLDITSSSLDKSASSLLMVIRVTTIVTELSRIELPILMPDILLYDAGSRVILTGNHSVGTILLYDLLPQGQFESSPKQIIRLESGHFAMGAALSHIASQTNLFILAAGGLVSQATGLSITSMIDVALKVVQYSRSDTQAQNTLVPMTARNNLKETASSHLEKLEIFGQVQDRVFGGMVSCSVDTSLFELKLPGNDRKAIRPIEVIAESVPGEATLQDIVVRLEKLERNQNEILSLLRQLVNNKRN